MGDESRIGIMGVLVLLALVGIISAFFYFLVWKSDERDGWD